MSDKQVIKQFGETLLKDMKRAIPSATGKTAGSMEVVFDSDGLGFKILGNQSIGALINGRKPTRKGAKKGSPTLQQMILQWIEARSIQPREANMSQKELSYAISNHIHKNGFSGKPNLFDGVLTDTRFDSLSKTLLENQGTVISSSILKQFK